MKAAHGAPPEVDISDQDERRTMLLDDGYWSPAPADMPSRSKLIRTPHIA
jgi:hypothetical protein